MVYYVLFFSLFALLHFFNTCRLAGFFMLDSLFVFYLKSFYLTNMDIKVIILGCGAGLMFALEEAILTFAQDHVVTIVDEPVDDFHNIILAEPPEPIEVKLFKRFNMSKRNSMRFYFKDDVFSGRDLFDDPCMNAYTRKPFVLPQTVYISQQTRLRNKAPPYVY